MKVFIINQFSQERVDYEKTLEKVNGDFIFYTKQKHVEAYKGIFNDITGFDNWDTNDNIYKSILDRSREEQIDYVIATHEFDLVKAGQLRDYLKLEGQSKESALAFRDKYEMKKRLKGKIGLPHFAKIKDVFDLYDFVLKYNYPFVLKPTDGAGSIGVQVVKNSRELAEILAKGIQSDLIAETFVEGDMYHIDGIYENGELLISVPSLYINGCLAFQKGEYLGSVMSDNEEINIRMNNAVKTILDTLPTPAHAIAFHAELFLTPGEQIVFCEIASRVGGGMISETLEFAKGIDILSESIKAQCGLPINITGTDRGLAGWTTIQPKKGKLIKMNTNLPYEWVKDCYVKESDIGKNFTGSNSSVDSIASLVVAGKSKEEIINRLDLVQAWFEENCEWKLEEDQLISN